MLYVAVILAMAGLCMILDLRLRKSKEEARKYYLLLQDEQKKAPTRNAAFDRLRRNYFSGTTAQAYETVMAADALVKASGSCAYWKIDRFTISFGEEERSFIVSPDGTLVPDEERREEPLGEPVEDAPEGDAFDACEWFELHRDLMTALCPHGTKSFLIPEKYLPEDEESKKTLLGDLISVLGYREAKREDGGIRVIPVGPAM